MTRVAVAGATGFIGGAVVQALEAAGMDVHVLPSLRAERGIDALAEHLNRCDVVVNAAGMAQPGSNDERALHDANALFPELLACAAAQAGAARFVHVSSASVQGRQDPLDETTAMHPFSTYSRSKAEGERRLLALRDVPAVVIYRATSVQGASRGVTQLLTKYAALPVLPIVQGGQLPVPVALLENTAAAIAHLAGSSRTVGPVVLHPWEGITVGSLLRSFGWNQRALPVPAAAARFGTRLGGLVTGRSPRFSSRMRSAELLLLGQAQCAERLQADGFVLPVGVDGYRDLADRVDARRQAEVS